MTIRRYNANVQRFAPLTKVVENDDGTLTVSGFASTELRDEDGEKVTADAMRAALPDYLQWGAVREMHGKSAAGTAISAEVLPDGNTDFSCLVVDDGAVKKVLAGVYKGFSIGGKATSRDPLDKSVITGLRLIEVSLVDRPANPGAVFTVVKLADALESSPRSENTMGRPRIRLKTVAKGAGAEGESAPAADVAIDPPKAEEPAAVVAADVIADPQADPTDKAAGAGDVRKSIYSISDFAYVLCGLRNVAGDAQFEADYEGDNSAVPKRLAALLTEAGAILVEMTIEEVAEMVGDLKVGPDVVEMFAGVTLEKKGAKFSKATRDQLAGVHKAMKDTVAMMDGMQYDGMAADDEDDSEKIAKAAVAEALEAANADALEKVNEVKRELAKVAGQRDEQAKRADVAEASVAKLNGQVQDAIATMKAKGYLRAVDKGDDSSAPTDKASTPGKPPTATVKVADSGARDPNAASRAITAIHKAGGTSIDGRR